MKTTKLALLAATLCASAITPALAQNWDTIGNVEIRGRGDRETRNFNMGGPVERLQLRAEGGSVMCRSVEARFGNGASRSIFNGPLPEGRAVNVDLPGRDRMIRSLSFNCSADRRDRASIRVTADVGRYREEWRRSPDWDRTWARMFNWGSNVVNDWQLVGTETFEGRGDVENSFTGWRGRRADAVALRPLDADARCTRVVANFGNGRSQNLNVNNGDYLRRGQYYKLDLPGDYRTIESVTMRCRATTANRVTMQIFTSR